MLCSVCKKNTAIIFTNKQNEKGENSLEGFCYNCAKEKGIKKSLKESLIELIAK